MPMTKLLCGLDGSGRYFTLVYIILSAMKAVMKLFSNPLFVRQLEIEISVSPLPASKNA